MGQDRKGRQGGKDGKGERRKGLRREVETHSDYATRKVEVVVVEGMEVWWSLRLVEGIGRGRR